MTKKWNPEYHHSADTFARSAVPCGLPKYAGPQKVFVLQQHKLSNGEIWCHEIWPLFSLWNLKVNTTILNICAKSDEALIYLFHKKIPIENQANHRYILGILTGSRCCIQSRSVRGNRKMRTKWRHTKREIYLTQLSLIKLPRASPVGRWQMKYWVPKVTWKMMTKVEITKLIRSKPFQAKSQL